MALWPNARYMTISTYRGLGVAPGLDAYIKGNGDRMNRFVGEQYTPSASTPDGYGMAATVPPLTAGSMSALRRALSVQEGASNLLKGGPMTATATVVQMSGPSELSMIVGLDGSVTISMAGNSPVLSLTIAMDGTGTMTLTGSAGLSMIVPFEASAVIATISGTSDLRGICSLEGEWTPFAELSPESLAAAVWSSIIESGYSAEEVLRIIAASAAGKSSGGPGSPVFRDLGDTKDRITGTADANGNRNAVSYDAT